MSFLGETTDPISTAMIAAYPPQHHRPHRGGTVKRLPVLIAAAALLAACSSSMPSGLPVALSTTRTPAPSQSTTAAYTAADQAACQSIDQDDADLVTLDQQLHAGTAEAFGIGIPIVGASDGVAKALLESPTAVKIKPDATAFSGALKALDAKIIGGGTIGPSSELAAVERAWRVLSTDCHAAGYTMVNVLP